LPIALAVNLSYKNETKMETKLHFALTIFLVLFFTSTKAQSSFILPKLNYSYNQLEPYIDAQTMEIHHSKHHQGYVNNLNKALDDKNANQNSLEEILRHISAYSTSVRNNAGGHFNHSLFWTILTPQKNTKPSPILLSAIVAQFGNMDSLKTLINNVAATRFGSGWAWLSVGNDKKLFVSSTANQDNPLMDVAEKQGTPILGIDVWEHAYYLNYQNKRGDYLSAIWNVINWDEVSRRYESIINNTTLKD
jgi:Fe-Mn family superoxide dismutase